MLFRKVQNGFQWKFHIFFRKAPILWIKAFSYVKIIAMFLYRDMAIFKKQNFLVEAGRN